MGWHGRDKPVTISGSSGFEKRNTLDQNISKVQPGMGQCTAHSTQRTAIRYGHAIVVEGCKLQKGNFLNGAQNSAMLQREINFVFFELITFACVN